MNILVSGLFSTAESYGKSDAILEILIMLLVAFILGYLFRYLLTKKSISDEYKEKYLKIKHDYELLEQKFKTFSTENEKLRKELEFCRSGKQTFTSVTKTSTSAPKPDDLKKVKGIGPKIERLLNERGIYTFIQLAETEISILEDVLDKAGPNFQFHNPATWPRQAKLAAEGKWDELKNWQENL